MNTEEKYSLIRAIRSADSDSAALEVLNACLDPVASDVRLQELENENTALRILLEENARLAPSGVTDIHEMIEDSVRRAVEEGRTTTRNRSIGKRLGRR